MAARRGRVEEGAELGAPQSILQAAPVVCLLRSTGDLAAGAFVGTLFGCGKGLITNKGLKASFRNAGSTTQTFAALAGLQGFIMCLMKRLRGKDDIINAAVAGCSTGLALSYQGAPQAKFHSCLTFAAFSCIMDGLTKQQAAMALTLDDASPTNKDQKGSILPPLMNAQDVFPSLCQTLVNKEHMVAPKPDPQSFDSI